jgi:3-phenylpropionate/trans-cinnamate dioxygenase ferredoxin reductase subunit
LLGKREPYAINTWFWSDQYDLNIQMIGDNQPAGGTLLVRKGEGKSFTRFSAIGDRLVGAICFGAPRDMAIVRRLMSKGYAVTDDSLITAPDLRKLL